MITRTRLLLLMAVFLMAIGCRKNPLNNLNDEEQRIYITNHDRTATFNNFRTYAIADKVVVVDGNNSSQQSTSADQAMMRALDQGLQSRGFKAAVAGGTADVGVQISRVIRTSTGFVSGPDYWRMWDPFYWGGWGAGWGAGWGGGWGGIGPGWTVMPYEVREGMLAIDIIDLTNNSSPRVLWNALVRGPGLSSTAAAEDIVNKLLAQSPYLQTN